MIPMPSALEMTTNEFKKIFLTFSGRGHYKNIFFLIKKREIILRFSIISMLFEKVFTVKNVPFGLKSPFFFLLEF